MQKSLKLRLWRLPTFRTESFGFKSANPIPNLFGSMDINFNHGQKEGNNKKIIKTEKGKEETSHKGGEPFNKGGGLREDKGTDFLNVLQ